MILSARKIFRESPHLKGWNDIVVGDQFQAAATAAMLEMTDELPLAKTTEEAAANHFRSQGAARFLHALMNLAETDVPPNKGLRSANLQHRI